MRQIDADILERWLEMKYADAHPLDYNTKASFGECLTMVKTMPTIDATPAQRPEIDPTDDDFGCVLNCAVRYALGRRTYMPYLVIGYITPLLPHLSDKTIWCFERDLEECTNYGDPEIDEPQWKQFQAAVKVEAERRNNRNAN